MGAGLRVVPLVEGLPRSLLSGDTRAPLLSPPASVTVAGLCAVAPVGLPGSLLGASTTGLPLLAVTVAGSVAVLPVSLSASPFGRRGGGGSSIHTKVPMRTRAAILGRP